MADSLRDIHCDAGEQWFEDTQSPEDSVLIGVLPEVKAEVLLRLDIDPNRNCTYSVLLDHYRAIDYDVHAWGLNRRRSKSTPNTRSRRNPLRKRRDVTRGHGTQARGRRARRRGRKTRQAQEG
ncbi:hypothetical protein PCH_Pc21g19670 [Penicillium rubens Wisconsin 54-1255]|uniref:Uncharacterized protein n=1 Tax=Penicillium rubens (strain ATCC 28089 / DSM 1075 / NRRL 1951 / Wisconsin 54-1255) TaxID=500485 RepID=B6HJK7_PENRW|nr:hypothetical protein PCH_Pc21g19670 [Penicillium rubens Wisconsin 54-1255]